MLQLFWLVSSYKTRSYTIVQFFCFLKQDLPFRLSLQFFSSLSELYAPVTQGHARLAFKSSFRWGRSNASIHVSVCWDVIGSSVSWHIQIRGGGKQRPDFCPLNVGRSFKSDDLPLYVYIHTSIFNVCLLNRNSNTIFKSNRVWLLRHLCKNTYGVGGMSLFAFFLINGRNPLKFSFLWTE